jgi:hypothetical protein
MNSRTPTVTKLKNALREWMGEPAVTHSEAG